MGAEAEANRDLIEVARVEKREWITRRRDRLPSCHWQTVKFRMGLIRTADE